MKIEVFFTTTADRFWHFPRTVTVLFFFPFFSIPNVLCEPTDLVGGKRPHLFARPSLNGLLAEVFRDFPQP